jgi:hypothetical protein
MPASVANVERSLPDTLVAFSVAVWMTAASLTESIHDSRVPEDGLKSTRQLSPRRRISRWKTGAGKSAGTFVVAVAGLTARRADERPRERLLADLRFDIERDLPERVRFFLERERDFLERERDFLERERFFLERERDFLERERLVLVRERDLFRERERFFLECERDFFRERERFFLERERDFFLERERDFFLERERDFLLRPCFTSWP